MTNHAKTRSLVSDPFIARVYRERKCQSAVNLVCILNIMGHLSNARHGLAPFSKRYVMQSARHRIVDL